MKSQEQMKLELLQNTTIRELQAILRRTVREQTRKKLMMSKGATGVWAYEPIDSDAKFAVALAKHDGPNLQTESSDYLIVTWRGQSEYHISAGLRKELDDTITKFEKAGASGVALRKAQRVTNTRLRITSHVDEYHIVDGIVFTRHGWSFLKEGETDVIEEGYEWAAAGPQESSLLGKDWHIMYDVCASERESKHIPMAVLKIVDPARAKRIEKARKARAKKAYS